MPSDLQQLQRAVESLARTIRDRFTQPEFLAGCEIQDITDIDQYATANGWIEVDCAHHGRQRVRYKGFPASIQVGDELDIFHFPDRKVFEIKGAGGTTSTGVDTVKVSKVWRPDGSATVLAGDNSGDTTVSGNMILSGSSKAIKGSGSNAPDLGSVTAAEKLGNIYISGDGQSDQAWSAETFDFELHDSANDLGITSHFLDNDTSFPAGWTEADAAGFTSTDTRYSYWLLLGSSGETSWDYRRQTSIDLENDIAVNATVTVLVGPLMWRDTSFTADVNYHLGLYRDNAGSIDTATYARIRLRFDSAASAWKIRGEESDGSTAHNGAETTLNAAPVNQPIYVAITLNNSASKLIQSWWGKMNDFALHTLLQQQGPTSPPTWGTFWVRFHMSRGAGSADRILIGSVDKQ